MVQLFLKAFAALHGGAEQSGTIVSERGRLRYLLCAAYGNLPTACASE
jgi:hypothetical protein